MNYKSLIIAVLAGALVATSCMKNLESASVTKVRDAKAEELKSLAELNKAQAAAATTLANAEASLKLAQAKLAEAQAAKLNAETEILKAELEYQIAYYKSLIEKISFEMELAALRHEKKMAETYAELLKALEAADEATFTYATELIEHIAIEDGTVQELAGKIAANEAQIVLLKEGLESIDEFTYEEVMDARAEIARLQNINEYLTECLKYDSRTLKNTISALKVDRMRVNDEANYLAEEKANQIKSYDELLGKLSVDNLTVESAVWGLDIVGALNPTMDGIAYIDENGEEVTVFTRPDLGIVGYTENTPAEVNVEGLSKLIELQAAEFADNLKRSKEILFRDPLYYFVEGNWGVSAEPLDGYYHSVTAPYAAEWYEKQAAIVAPKLEAAEAAYDAAYAAYKEAITARDAAEENRFAAILAAANTPKDWMAEGLANELKAAVADVQNFYPEFAKAQEEYGKYNLEDAKEEVRKANAALALYAPVLEEATAEVEKAVEAHGKAVAAVNDAQAALNDKQDAYDEAKDAEYAAYVAYELADKDSKEAAKAAYEEAKKVTAKADEALNEAYSVLNKAKNAESKAKSELLEKNKAQLAADAQNQLLENAYYDAIAKVSKAEQAVSDYAWAEETMKQLETNLDDVMARVEVNAVPSELIAVKEAELASETARQAVSEVYYNVYRPARSLYLDLEGIYNSFVSSQEYSQEYYDGILAEAQQEYNDAMLALEEAGTALQEILDEKYDSYVAMYERLNTISESYNETSELYTEAVNVKAELTAQIEALGNELNETGKLEKAIAAHNARIAELETYVAALLDGTTIEAAIAALEHENEMLKEALEAHQIILEALHAELENLLGVETEDSPVQE